MHCKHSFKNTTRLFCVHSPFEKCSVICPDTQSYLIVIFSLSDSSEEEK